MAGDAKLEAFRKKLLLFPPLFIAVISLPLALGLVPPNRLYGLRTPASLASSASWYAANRAAGAAAVLLGLAGAILVYRLLKRRPVDVRLALAATGVALAVLLGAFVAGLLAA